MSIVEIDFNKKQEEKILISEELEGRKAEESFKLKDGPEVGQAMGDVLKFWLGDYRITSPYGPRIHPITGQESIHSGLDLVIGHRCPIRASTPGQIVFAGWGGDYPGHYSYGNLVIMADCQGAHHVYGHLDAVSLDLVPGDWLRAGTVIGLQGATGRVTGSHLHYEVRKRGDYASHTEPREYLEEYYQLHGEILQENISSNNFA